MRMCSMTSGSSGNSILVKNREQSVLIDCGVSGKYLQTQLDALGECFPGAILITHEHSDHVKGLGVLMRKYHVPVYLTEKTLRRILWEDRLGKLDESLFHVIEADKPFSVEGFEVMPFEISHDAADPVGYRLTDGKTHMAIATDLGCWTDYTVGHLRGLDAVLLEANHDLRMLECGSYPYHLKNRIRSGRGHLSNEDSACLLEEILDERLQHVLLGHLSSENNYGELARLTVEQHLAAGPKAELAGRLHLDVAVKQQRSEWIEV